MGLGVLGDRHLEHVPGKVIYFSQDEANKLR